MGADGAGHYVKMVHKGIEYGDMQLIAESYDVLKRVAGLSNEELGRVYVEWNKGELDSYLIEITSKIFSKKDEETGKDLVDVILDRAAQKGTGKWTSQNALDLGAPSEEYKWDLQYGQIAKIFRAGCIIRAGFLQKITDAYKTNADLHNLLLDPYFSDIATKYQGALRDVVVAAVKAGVPVPAFSSAVACYDRYRPGTPPANLVQAPRDILRAQTIVPQYEKGTFRPG